MCRQLKWGPCLLAVFLFCIEALPARVRSGSPKPKIAQSKKAGSKKRSEKKRSNASEKSPFPGSVLVSPAGQEKPPKRSVHYHFELESGFGMMLLTTPGISLNAQARWRVARAYPIYAGVIGQFALFSPAYYAALMPAVWYHFVLQRAPLAHLSLGLTMGPSFTHQLDPLPIRDFTAFIDVSVSFELDELTTIRGQFLPGIVGGSFAANMALLVGFRFR